MANQTIKLTVLIEAERNNSRFTCDNTNYLWGDSNYPKLFDADSIFEALITNLAVFKNEFKDITLDLTIQPEWNYNHVETIISYRFINQFSQTLKGSYFSKKSNSYNFDLNYDIFTDQKEVKRKAKELIKEFTKLGNLRYLDLMQKKNQPATAAA
jgi:hypothetical protein